MNQILILLIIIDHIFHSTFTSTLNLITRNYETPNANTCGARRWGRLGL